MAAAQVIRSTETGPIYSNGGKIEVTSTGEILGGPDGIDVDYHPITVLLNLGQISGEWSSRYGVGVGILNHKTIHILTNFGEISGAQDPFNQIAGGDALLNLGRIGALTNNGQMLGGDGGGAVTTTPNGGAGLVNQGEIARLDNRAAGTIAGGAGGAAYHATHGGDGGIGVVNQGKVSSFRNLGTIDGGAGAVAINAGSGAAGVVNFGQIGVFVNAGDVAGGAGGGGGYITPQGGPGAGGAGVANSGFIRAFYDTGAIQGGGGGVDIANGPGATGGAGGVGLSTAVMTSLEISVSGSITGGSGGSGLTGGDGGDGVDNTASLTRLINSGEISGGDGGGLNPFSPPGSVTGAGGVGFANSGSLFFIRNTGTILGGAGSEAGAAVDNSGSIDSFYNFGEIATTTPDGSPPASPEAGSYTGSPAFENSGTIQTLVNNGVVANASGGAAVMDRGSIASFVNRGEIDGDVLLAADDTLTNTGRIVGDLFMGDFGLLNDRGGSLSQITASNGDVLEFASAFGKVAIDDFIASGANHDIILLSGDGYSSFASLRPAISQAGEDTLIKVSAVNSITLDDTLATSLTASDFRFGK